MSAPPVDRFDGLGYGPMVTGMLLTLSGGSNGRFFVGFALFQGSIFYINLASTTFLRLDRNRVWLCIAMQLHIYGSFKLNAWKIFLINGP